MISNKQYYNSNKNPIDCDFINKFNSMNDIDPLYSQKYTSYVNIDSATRQIHPTNIYEPKICNLDSHPIEFTNGSSKVKIYLANHNFKTNQNISLNNVVSKNLMLAGALSIKKNSMYLRINHASHGLSLFGLYSEYDANEFEPVTFVDNFDLNFLVDAIRPDTKQYYILKKNHSIDLSIQLDNIIGNMIGNISVNYLNSRHIVYILFTKNQTKFEMVTDAYIIKLNRKSNINYKSSASVYIKYNNLFGIPLSYLNNSMHQYSTILSTAPDYFIIDIGYKAVVNPCEYFHDADIEMPNNFPNRGGGTQSYIRLINETIRGYPDPNNYLIILDKVYRNVVSAKIISSTFPNSQTMVNKTNNKLYWRNIDDGNHTYSLEIPPGNYTPIQLEKKLESIFANTIRYPYLSEKNNFQRFDSDGNLKYHFVKVNIDSETNIVTLSAHKQMIRKKSIIVPIYDQVKFELDFKIQNINIFDTDSDMIFIYSTQNIHLVHNSLYIANKICHKYIFEGIIESDRSVLINFYKKNDTNNSVNQEIASINTKTILEKFTFDDIFNIVYITNHQLKINDLIITDQFVLEEILIFEIISIISENAIKVKKCEIGKKYKFIYNDYLINFNTNICQIDNLITKIEPDTVGQTHMRLCHPNHNLDLGFTITINDETYIITKIIDDDSYEIYNDFSTDMCFNSNTICISYPDIFQLCFNFADTIGNLLCFDRIGEKNAITDYAHIIKNNNYNRKLICNSKYKSDYFYITCPELNTGIEYYRNTGPVTDVFAQIRWIVDDCDNNISFDSFVPTVKIYDQPIDILTQLHIQIVHPDGQLVDLNGTNHSFTIEITEIYNQPSATDISARINTEILSNRI